MWRCVVGLVVVVVVGVVVIGVVVIVTFAQGTYNYIPETNHVSRVCSVAAML